MKIGILTFHCAHNYGAVLQGFALQEFLRSLGHDVKIIDYKPPYLIKPYKPLRFCLSRHIKWMVKNAFIQVKKYSRDVRRYKAFRQFIETRLSLMSYDAGCVAASNIDTFVLGSDQIWNPLITGGDDVFWGDLPFERSGKKLITYAASMGRDSIPESDKKRISEKLKNFDAISVRESSLKEMLSPLTDKEITHVLDPTLLAPRSVWDKLDDNVKERGYVLVYQVGQNPNTMEIAKHIAYQLNVEFIQVEASVGWRVKPENRSCASPEDFVSYVKHASCVVTTSFHGTAFSVIFNKPFYTIALGNGGDGRSRSLLQSLHLGNRMIDPLDRPQFSDIDYSEANKRLSELRKNSEFFLTQNLI